MPWKRREQQKLIWRNLARFYADVNTAVTAEEAAFHATAEALAAKGLLTAEKEQTARPTLIVEIVDMRNDRTPTLPLPDCADSRIHTAAIAFNPSWTP